MLACPSQRPGGLAHSRWLGEGSSRVIFSACPALTQPLRAQPLLLLQGPCRAGAAPQLTPPYRPRALRSAPTNSTSQRADATQIPRQPPSGHARLTDKHGHRQRLLVPSPWCVDAPAIGLLPGPPPQAWLHPPSPALCGEGLLFLQTLSPHDSAAWDFSGF